VLAPAKWPLRYHWFNLKWGAPNGRLVRGLLSRKDRAPWRAQLAGCFAFQHNNTTRAFEYPWAFEALGSTGGLRVLEVGGSLSGFQFVVDRAGAAVVNVDPGDDSFAGIWPTTLEHMSLLNGLFGTTVTLRKCYLADAQFPDSSFDRVVSISVFEHIPEPDLAAILTEVRRLLKPGGLLVLTVDLFLNVRPFAEAESNEWGRNVSVKWIVDTSGLELVHGNPRELFGYPEFDAQAIWARRGQFLIGKYPAMVQTIILRRRVQAA
jgi:SAM-dependent methyltransferase